jgi:hypothetical protein
MVLGPRLVGQISSRSSTITTRRSSAIVVRVVRVIVVRAVRAVTAVIVVMVVIVVVHGVCARLCRVCVRWPAFVRDGPMGKSGKT